MHHPYGSGSGHVAATLSHMSNLEQAAKAVYCAKNSFAVKCMLFFYYQIWTVMWPRTAFNDFFHLKSAFSEFTVLTFCLLRPSCPSGH